MHRQWRNILQRLKSPSFIFNTNVDQKKHIVNHSLTSLKTEFNKNITKNTQIVTFQIKGKDTKSTPFHYCTVTFKPSKKAVVFI